MIFRILRCVSPSANKIPTGPSLPLSFRSKEKGVREGERTFTKQSTQYFPEQFGLRELVRVGDEDVVQGYFVVYAEADCLRINTSHQ